MDRHHPLKWVSFRSATTLMCAVGECEWRTRLLSLGAERIALRGFDGHVARRRRHAKEPAPIACCVHCVPGRSAYISLYFFLALSTHLVFSPPMRSPHFWRAARKSHSRREAVAPPLSRIVDLLGLPLVAVSIRIVSGGDFAQCQNEDGKHQYNKHLAQRFIPCRLSWCHNCARYGETPVR